MCSAMALLRNNGELFSERRIIIDAAFNYISKSDHGFKVSRRGRRFGRITKHRLLRWIFLLLTLFSIFLTIYGLKKFVQGEARDMGISSWYFVSLYTNSFLLSVTCLKIPTCWIFTCVSFIGVVTAKIESEFSMPQQDLPGERNLQDNSFLINVGKPPKSKRQKRKCHSLQLIYFWNGQC